MALGVALSSFVGACPLPLLFFLLLLLVLSLLVTHCLRLQFPFLPLSCLFFLLVGFVRARQGDCDLLPHQAYEGASRLLRSATDRLHSIGFPPDVNSLLEAMLFGQRHNLSRETFLLYSDAGASHVLALSGLHLGILFGLFDIVLLRVLYNACLRYAICIFGLLLMWVYVALTGFPVSLVRASVMMSLFLFSQMRMGGTNGWHTWGVAAVAILFVSPSALRSVSFQLSFAAVAGILAFYSLLRDLLVIRHVGLHWLWCAVVASLSAQAATLPLVAYYFHHFSLSSFFLSPFYILLATALMYSALLALVFGSCMVPAVTALAGALHGLLRFGSLIPGSQVKSLFVSPAQVALFYMALICLVPALRATRPRASDAGPLRLVRFLRSWPYLVAAILCFSLSLVL